MVIAAGSLGRQADSPNKLASRTAPPKARNDILVGERLDTIKEILILRIAVTAHQPHLVIGARGKYYNQRIFLDPKFKA
jgi:hypothetical protein